MSELEYRILIAIKEYKEYYKKLPDISFISNRIMYSKQSTRYHLKKLEKMNLIVKHDKTYDLKVNI